MAKKNKSVDFGSFMGDVQKNRENLDRFKAKEEETIEEPKTAEEVHPQVSLQSVADKQIEEEKRAPGRKPTVMGKKNGKTVYFDDDTQAKFRSIKYLQNIDATNIIYTAVVCFMEKYCQDGKLNDTAIDKIKETCKL